MKKDHPGVQPDGVGSKDPRANPAERLPDAAFAAKQMRSTATCNQSATIQEVRIGKGSYQAFPRSSRLLR